MPHPLMALTASVLAVTKFRISGVTAIIVLVVIVLVIAAVGYAVQRTKRRRSAPPDDWERNPSQRG